MKHYTCLLLISFLTNICLSQKFNSTARIAAPTGLCDGVLGQPTVNIDFGSGNNPGPPLATGITNYTYINNCGVTPTQYSIFNNVNVAQFCNSNWHQIPEDHTPGDINGYMMVVDADHTTREDGIFYTQRITNLQKDFPYEFSVWTGNMDLPLTCGRIPVLPELFFLIVDRTGGRTKEIAQVRTGELPTTSFFEWKKFGIKFFVPADVTDIDLMIGTKTIGRCGNDLILDDIAFAPCYPPLIAGFEDGQPVYSKRICQPGPINLYSYWPPTGNPFNNVFFKWQYALVSAPDNWIDIPNSNAQNIVFTIPDRVNYIFRVIASELNNPNQSLTSNSIVAGVIKININFDPNSINLCQGSSSIIPLDATTENSAPNDTYFWSWSPSTYLSATDISNPIFTAPSLTPPPINGPMPAPQLFNYIVSATTKEGCMGQKTIQIPVKNPRNVAVPNAFTPNGDGINDLFRPINLPDYYPGYRFAVYNRFGNQIFVSDGPTYNWDGTYNGTIQNANETFTWLVTGTATSCPLKNISPGITGNVILIR